MLSNSRSATDITALLHMAMGIPLAMLSPTALVTDWQAVCQHPMRNPRRVLARAVRADRQACGRTSEGPEAARSARRYAGGVVYGIRPHAGRARRRQPRSPRVWIFRRAR